MNIDLPAPTSALVVVAHPDDAEFQCGATLAKWANLGTEVNYLICTDGSKGTWNPNCDQNQLIQDREREQRNAAQSLGATGQIVFLGHTDGELSSDIETRSEVAFVIRNIQPEVILAHDPWKRYRLHPDHRHAGLLAIEGIVGARDPFFFKNTALSHTAQMPFSCLKLTSQITQKMYTDGTRLKWTRYLSIRVSSRRHTKLMVMMTMLR